MSVFSIAAILAKAGAPCVKSEKSTLAPSIERRNYNLSMAGDVNLRLERIKAEVIADGGTDKDIAASQFLGLKHEIQNSTFDLYAKAGKAGIKATGGWDSAIDPGTSIVFLSAIKPFWKSLEVPGTKDAKGELSKVQIGPEDIPLGSGTVKSALCGIFRRAGWDSALPVFDKAKRPAKVELEWICVGDNLVPDAVFDEVINGCLTLAVMVKEEYSESDWNHLAASIYKDAAQTVAEPVSAE